MNYWHRNKARRSWTLVLMVLYFVFAGQATAMTLHTSAIDFKALPNIQSASQTEHHADMPHCHEQGIESTDSNILVESSSCCDQGCTMTLCHPGSVMLSSLLFSPLAPRKETNFITANHAIQRRPNSLYRPPIIG